MEVLGAVAASIQLVQGIFQISRAIKGAVKESEGFLDELQAVDKSLISLKRQLEQYDLHKPLPAAIESLASASEASYESDGTLKILEAKLTKIHNKLESHSETKLGLRVWWIRVQTDIKSEVESIHRLRVIIEHHLNELGREDLRTIKIDQEVIKKGQYADRRERRLQRVLQWLSPLQPRPSQTDDETYPSGDWLFDMPEFKTWKSGKYRGLLWLYGDPGTGKSVLTTQIIEQLKQGSTPGDILVLDLPIQYKDADVQTVEYLFGSLVKQLILFDTASFPSLILDQLYEKSQEGGYPDASQMTRILCDELQRFSRVYLVIDDWNELIDYTGFNWHLAQLTKAENVNAVATSRFSEEETALGSALCAECGKGREEKLKIYWFCGECECYQLCSDCKDNGASCGQVGHSMVQPDHLYQLVRPSNDEIKGYVKWEISRSLTNQSSTRRIDKGRGLLDLTSSALDRMYRDNPSLVEKIQDEIAIRAAGNYQLAKLHIEDIKNMSLSSRKEIEEALAQLPEGLPAAYEATLSRLLTHDPKRRVPRSTTKTLKFVFYWISCTGRALSMAELQCAKDIVIGATAYEQEDDYIREEDLIKQTGGLVYIDNSMSAVRIPLSMHTYLRESKDQHFGSEDDIDIALRLLTCLNYDILGESPLVDAEIDSILEEVHLLEYACQYWPEHVILVYEEPQVQKPLIKFLTNQGKVDTYMQIAYKLSNKATADFDVRRGLSGLHLAARFGFASIIPQLVTEFGVDSADPRYNQTALMYASRYGHIEVVKHLLQNHASVNVQSSRGSSALFEAYAGRWKYIDTCNEVLELLLEADGIDINARSGMNSERTLLMMASYIGDSEIVQLLISRSDVEINLTDQDGNSALTLAVFSQGEAAVETVQALLDNSYADLNLPNKGGITPLLAAASRPGWSAVVSLLLEKGADAAIKDPSSGATPFQRGVESYDADIVKVFLAHNSPIDSRDQSSRTLLHHASAKGDTNIIKMLLDAGLDVNATDSHGETSLHAACREGCLEAVQLLLSRGADKAKLDNEDRTPLVVSRQNASQMRYNRIMNVLDPSPEGHPPQEQVASHAEQLPTWSLVRVSLMDELLRRIQSDTYPRSSLLEKDPDTGNTALHWASIENKPKFLEVLLTAGVSQDATNDLSETALFLAVSYYRPEIVAMLLQHPDPPLETKDAKGMPPLEVAQRRGYYLFAVKLLAKGATMDDTVNHKHLNATFMMAVQLQNAAVAEQLIKRGADHLAVSDDGLTAKQIALSNQDTETLRVLDTHKSFFIPVKTNSGSSGFSKPEPEDSDSGQESAEQPTLGPDMTKSKFKARYESLPSIVV